MNKQTRFIVIIASALIILGCAVSAYFGYQYATEESKHYMTADVSVSEQKDMLNKLGTALESMNNSNVLLNVQESESSYITTLHNSKGESLTQSTETGYVTVYRKDNKAIRYHEYIEFGNDSNVISIMNSVYKMAQDGSAKVYGASEEDLDDKYTQVIIDVNGWDKVNELYSNIDSSLGTVMVDQLKSTIESSDTGMEGKQFNFRFLFILESEVNYLNSVGCYIYFGNNTNITWDEPTMSTNWALVGSMPVEEWSLSDDWYTLPFEDIENWDPEKDDNADKANELLKNTLAELTDMVARVNESLADDTEDTTGSEDTSDIESSDDVVDGETNNDVNSSSGTTSSDDNTAD